MLRPQDGAVAKTSTNNRKKQKLKALLHRLSTDTHTHANDIVNYKHEVPEGIPINYPIHTLTT